MTTKLQTERSRWIALYVLCAGVLMIILDTTIVNVALPSIQNDLHFTDSSLAWVVNSYLIAFGGLLLLAGRIGDLFGRRRVFLTGLVIFTAASLLCGVAQNQEMLVAARFVQGVGGALTSAVVLGMIVTMFPEPQEQAKAIGVYAFVASAGGAVGLLVGGVLTQSISWHWIFFVNLPIGVATVLAAGRLLDADPRSETRSGADLPGAVLITSALMLAVYTIVKPAAERGWTAPPTLILGAVSAALIAAFLIRQATAAQPLMPLRIFRARALVAANVVQMLSVVGMFGMFFLGALFLQRVRGYDALQIGLAFLPVTVLMGGLSVRFSARLTARFGSRNMLIAGLAVIAAGLALFAQAPSTSTYLVNVLPPMVLLGSGAGLAFPSLMTLGMSDTAPQDAGLASGLLNTSAQVGGALGLAVLATVSASRSTRLAATGTAKADALTGGYHLAFWIGVALIAVAIGVALVILRDRKEPVAAPATIEAVEQVPVG
ncbi:MAG: DHA2 family efflux MFS transporter permease subunit [Catenulispora sp.]|nr:DHA2 family efflux MFS transporter permease subunit [Catenulispora sp.]